MNSGDILIKKQRLDILIYLKGLTESREKAKFLIKEGKVLVNNQLTKKPSILCCENSEIILTGNLKYVSRGGLKLEKAIKKFQINLKNKIALDVGASTGGFTDCMLQHGCIKVYAVDVGFGQLHWKLRNDPRVINIERTNIRYINTKLIKDNINFFTIDVSFISLGIVLDNVTKILNKGVNIYGVCLIKPQFEASKHDLNNNGVIKSSALITKIIKKIIKICLNYGFSVENLDFSPITGPNGNIEYLIFLKQSAIPKVSKNINICEIETNSHKILKKYIKI
ncbi:MAG: TlyA family RNA methyltransferase [Candidatus Improbicoccus devescovinae]|nr:MAG: TlyA family RNA methyltransferase [Candidatus Improbicoccus devescovinae]